MRAFVLLVVIEAVGAVVGFRKSARFGGSSRWAMFAVAALVFSANGSGTSDSVVRRNRTTIAPAPEAKVQITEGPMSLIARPVCGRQISQEARGESSVFPAAEAGLIHDCERRIHRRPRPVVDR